MKTKNDNRKESIFLRLWASIVGPSYGFSGEGNEQWYYTLSLAINLMLLWCIKSEVALVFTILSVIHYITVFVYGFLDFAFDKPIFSYIYLGVHAIIILIAMFTNLLWTIITSAITVFMRFLAPDCTGDNIFYEEPWMVEDTMPFLNKQKRANTSYRGFVPIRGIVPMLFNTAVFIAFVVIAFVLPINLIIKFTIIVAMMILHPIVDLFAGECVILPDTVEDAIDNIIDSRECKE